MDNIAASSLMNSQPLATESTISAIQDHPLGISATQLANDRELQRNPEKDGGGPLAGLSARSSVVIEDETQGQVSRFNRSRKGGTSGGSQKNPQLFRIQRSFDEPVFNEPTSIAVNMGDHEQTSKQVNDVNFLRKMAPTDLKGCLQFIFEAVMDGRHNSDEIQQAYEKMVVAQLAILADKGITTRDQLFDLLTKAQWIDSATVVAHGVAGGAAFNGVAGALNFGGAEFLTAKLGITGGSVGAMTATGAVLGAALSVADTLHEPAGMKTFSDAYYTRVPASLLPDFMKNVQQDHASSRGELAYDVATGFGTSYGARNVIRWATTAVIVATATGLGAPAAGITVAGTVDNVLDPVGGAMAGVGFRHITNRRSIEDGQHGIPYFLASTDLAARIDALKKKPYQHAASAAYRGAAHALNSVTQLHNGLRASVETKGLAGNAVLTVGIAATLGLRAAIENALPSGPLGHVVGEAVKYAALEAAYLAYGATIGALGASPAPKTPLNATIQRV